jgi:hypothetical protein
MRQLLPVVETFHFQVSFKIVKRRAPLSETTYFITFKTVQTSH